MSIDHASNLKALHLYGMAQAWSELQAEKPKQAHFCCWQILLQK